MWSVNDIVSKELQVQPLKTGETREFVLVRSGYIDPNINGGQPVSPAGHSLPGEDIIQDPYDIKHPIKSIFYITGFTPIKEPGKPIFHDPQFGRVRFGRTGRIVVTADNIGLYSFLKLHNKNRDNKNRLLKYKPVFFEVNPKRDLDTSRARFAFKSLAGSLLLQMSDEQMEVVAKKINADKSIGITVNSQQDPDYLRDKLSGISEKHPEAFIEATGDQRSIATVLVNKAKTSDLILFDRETSTWNWGDRPKKTQKIAKIAEGNNPDAGLVDFLVQEGTDVLKELSGRRSDFYH
jgi:hypothetical protein